MTFFIPQWDHGEVTEDLSELYLDGPPASVLDSEPLQWQLDDSIGTAGGIVRRWDTIKAKFRRTCYAIRLLEERYRVPVRTWAGLDANPAQVEAASTSTPALPPWASHAIVLAHIAARRTDDPKLGVGSVIVEDDRYISLAQHLDYPQTGADDSVEDEELKYDYILHSEQNALLWRNPSGHRMRGDVWLVCTKMPCDECSPMIHDCGIRRIVTVPQMPKRMDDPARLRGLTYERVHGLMDQIIVFDR
ncbi:Cytidine and dCMP deaminase domain-containing protein 1 [Irineochytrium annulatum]|nr:Cytidine and dCMP deaminase domain-containing protein 1 [Irineochytrium annulatum]